MIRIGIINGPNLNLLGVREPEVYGTKTFEDYFQQLKNEFSAIELVHFQSNVEGVLVDKLHEWGFIFDGIIINAGAYTHTSIALGDAIAAIKTPVIQVHISNVLSREQFRHVDYLAHACKGLIMGFGLQSYQLAITALLKKN